MRAKIGIWVVIVCGWAVVVRDGVVEASEIAQLNQGDVAELEMPAPRSSAPMLARVGDQQLVIFGGHDQDRQLLGDIWAYNWMSNTWKELGVGEGTDNPAARVWHAMAMHPEESRMYLFGGFDGSNDLNDIWRFSFSLGQWKQLFPGTGAPNPRDRHSLSATDEALYVFGGYVGTYVNDLWKYNIKEMSWEQLVPSGGVLPPKRRSHSACIENNKLYVFGGFNGYTPFSDLWEYSIAENIFVDLRTKTRPAKRYRHGLVPDGAGGVVLFGGVEASGSLKADMWRHTNGVGWEHLQPTYDEPVERSDMGMCYVKSKIARDKGRVFVFGGYDGSDRHNDMFKYEISSGQWRQLFVPTEETS